MQQTNNTRVRSSFNAVKNGTRNLEVVSSPPTTLILALFLKGFLMLGFGLFAVSDVSGLEPSSRGRHGAQHGWSESDKHVVTSVHKRNAQHLAFGNYTAFGGPRQYFSVRIIALDHVVKNVDHGNAALPVVEGSESESVAVRVNITRYDFSAKYSPDVHGDNTNHAWLLSSQRVDCSRDCIEPLFLDLSLDCDYDFKFIGDFDSDSDVPRLPGVARTSILLDKTLLPIPSHQEMRWEDVGHVKTASIEISELLYLNSPSQLESGWHTVRAGLRRQGCANHQTETFYPYLFAVNAFSKDQEYFQVVNDDDVEPIHAFDAPSGPMALDRFPTHLWSFVTPVNLDTIQLSVRRSTSLGAQVEHKTHRSQLQVVSILITPNVLRDECTDWFSPTIIHSETRASVCSPDGLKLRIDNCWLVQGTFDHSGRLDIPVDLESESLTEGPHIMNVVKPDDCVPCRDSTGMSVTCSCCHVKPGATSGGNSESSDVHGSEKSGSRSRTSEQSPNAFNGSVSADIAIMVQYNAIIGDDASEDEGNINSSDDDNRGQQYCPDNDVQCAVDSVDNDESSDLFNLAVNPGYKGYWSNSHESAFGPQWFAKRRRNRETANLGDQHGDQSFVYRPSGVLASDFCESMNGRSIHFLGDSVMRQQFKDMAFWLKWSRGQCDAHNGGKDGLHLPPDDLALKENKIGSILRWNSAWSSSSPPPACAANEDTTDTADNTADSLNGWTDFERVDILYRPEPAFRNTPCVYREEQTVRVCNVTLTFTLLPTAFCSHTAATIRSLQQPGGVIVVNSGFWDIVRPRCHRLQQVYLQKVFNLFRELRRSHDDSVCECRVCDNDMDDDQVHGRTRRSSRASIFKLTLPPVMHQDDAWLLNEVALELLHSCEFNRKTIGVLDGRNMIVNGMYLRDAQHFAAPVTRALNLELAEMLCGGGECKKILHMASNR